MSVSRNLFRAVGARLARPFQPCLADQQMEDVPLGAKVGSGAQVDVSELQQKRCLPSGGMKRCARRIRGPKNLPAQGQQRDWGAPPAALGAAAGAPSGAPRALLIQRCWCFRNGAAARVGRHKKNNEATA